MVARTVKIRYVGPFKSVDLPDLEAFGVKRGEVVDAPTEMARNLVDGGLWERHTDEPAAKPKRPASKRAPKADPAPVAAPEPADAPPADENTDEPVVTAEESE